MNSRANLNVTILAGLAALAMLLAAPIVAAQDGDGNTVTLNVETHDEGGASPYWFTIEGYEGRNPAILLEPGTQVTANVENVGDTVHNFALDDSGVTDCATASGETGPSACSTPILNSGDTATINFTVAEDAAETFQYWCDPHKSADMVGTVATTQEAFDNAQNGGNGDGGDGGNESPGFTTFVAVAAGLGAALLVQRRR